MPRGYLKVDGAGDYRVRDIVTALQELERAYNHIVAFDRIVSQYKERIGSDHRGWAVGPPKLPRIRIPSSKIVPSLVLPEEQLVLVRVQLSSPGFWEFLGSLNPLEVIRQWVADAHERRKDKEYREAAERQRLQLENALRENQVIREKVAILQELGATDADLASLLNQLVYEPLLRLEQHQDKGIFTNARINGPSDAAK